MISAEGTEVKSTIRLHCDICKLLGSEELASYDMKTKQGPWAYLCEKHKDSHGIPEPLGTGRGQKIIYELEESK